MKGFKCDLCDKSYSNNNALSYHKNTKHEYIVSKFNCNVCGLKFSTERTLSRHRKSLHGEENACGEAKFDCAECGTTFSRKDIYVRHMREKHFGAKANFEYVEDLTRLTSINCDI